MEAWKGSPKHKMFLSWEINLSYAYYMWDQWNKNRYKSSFFYVNPLNQSLSCFTHTLSFIKLRVFLKEAGEGFILDVCWASSLSAFLCSSFSCRASNFSSFWNSFDLVVSTFTLAFTRLWQTKEQMIKIQKLEAGSLCHSVHGEKHEVITSNGPVSVKEGMTSHFRWHYLNRYFSQTNF